jgi:hypothetical protein
VTIASADIDPQWGERGVPPISPLLWSTVLFSLSCG